MLKSVSPEALRIATVRTKARQLILSWKSVSGRSYEVHSSPDLDHESWSVAAGPIQATGATTYWTSPVSGSVTGLVYRIMDLGE
jgi:hypothetical protein